MFSLAYVLLPFSDVPPAEAIRASLARFQRGGNGDVADDWLTFHDEAEVVRAAHEAELVFTDEGKEGLRIEGDRDGALFCLRTDAVRSEMAQLGLRRWAVRFADAMTLPAFFGRFVRDLVRHPVTGRYGSWLNPLGRWDWWDLGGRFDGAILGDRSRPGVRSVAAVSSGESRGRRVLANIEDVLCEAVGQEPVRFVC